MESTKIAELNKLSTYDLAFNLATGRFDAEEKLEVLNIIKQREENSTKSISIKDNLNGSVKKPKTTPPLKGSKAERIYNLLKEGKTASEVYQIMNKGKKKPYVYHPEIYRVGKDYFPERFVKN